MERKNYEDMYVCKGLAILLARMLENETDNVELSFNIDKANVRLKVELIELKMIEKGE